MAYQVLVDLEAAFGEEEPLHVRSDGSLAASFGNGRPANLIAWVEARGLSMH
jgi:hypothetical protein